MQKKLDDDPFHRVPEGVMEVVGPGKKLEKLVLMEATLDSDFRLHKPEQVSGTLMIGETIYPRDTPFEYHFLSPRDPGPNALAVFAQVKARFPNAKIVWHVVRGPDASPL
jgi:hypothetical protein